MLTAGELPNESDALKALLLARFKQILGLQVQLNTRAAEIKHLKSWIAKLRRMQFGRKSEKLDHQIEQLEVQLKMCTPTTSSLNRKLLLPIARLVSERRSNRCSNICRVMKKCISRQRQIAQPAEET